MTRRNEEVETSFLEELERKKKWAEEEEEERTLSPNKHLEFPQRVREAITPLI